MKKLFLLDGMALVYRAHFALAARPIFTSKGVNTSALYGFTQTVLEILNKQQPTHIAVAFDTDAPTQRHIDFPEYKASREAMPEDISKALPHVRSLLGALRIPILTCEGYEADDLIGTLACRAQKEGFTCYMVTPDKDFGQLVSEKVFLYKPGRMGDSVEIMGIPEIQNRWGIQRPEQVVDVLALMGDSIDNIPGVPGIGEKTAMKLIAQYGSVDEVLAHTAEMKGRLKQNLEEHREIALLSKKLATLDCDAPCPVDIETLKLQPRDDEKLKALLVEFEFNSIGKRLFGENFSAGRGYQAGAARPAAGAVNQEFVLTAEPQTAQTVASGAPLKRLADVPHSYQPITSAVEVANLVRALGTCKSFSFAAIGTAADPKQSVLLGLAFCLEAHSGYYVHLPADAAHAAAMLDQIRPALETAGIEKVGHNLKYHLSLLQWRDVRVHGVLFDNMVAHSLLEPDLRHSLDYLAEAFLGYTPLKLEEVIGGAQLGPATDTQKLCSWAVEQADLAWQLRERLVPRLKAEGQERVFYEIEAPLIPVLVAMEREGIKVDPAVLAEFGMQLAKEIDELEKTICRLAGTTFNLNSPRQLGQILFDVLKICEAPKKTRTGQYSTDEQTLVALAPDHEIVQRLLEHRSASKLKSTYIDTLPAAIWPRTSRVHTTYNQVMTATGRLNSQDPNLQNIPIRSERGQEIRKAFVARDSEHCLLSADYSQIELRIIAALSREAGLLEAFRTGVDVHTATAAKVFGVFLELVTPEMRRKAKMVNYGIAYGISAFGLAQRLNIPRKEAAEIIDQYFKQFGGIRRFMEDTIAFARKQGYVQTVTGRRRYIRDINSSNNTVRSAAERNAINAPVQGTAADMIKIAMVNIQQQIEERGLRTRMLLQVHDELLFDVYRPELDQVQPMVQEAMQNALPLEVPILVEVGTGRNWLEAH